MAAIAVAGAALYFAGLLIPLFASVTVARMPLGDLTPERAA
jgi:hypothetical protein